MEFENIFTDEESCLNYIIQFRWPSGIICPHCSGKKLWRTNSLLQCANCGQQVRILAGTVFQDTKLSIKLWFRAIWWVVTQKNGASAKGLSRNLGISYKSTWGLLHKLRRAMVFSGRSKLNGIVEVDESFLGGAEPGVIGRGSLKKSLIIIAVEVYGLKLGRIRMRLIEDATTESLMDFITEYVELESTIHTDGWAGYSKVESLGYTHIITQSTGNLDALPHVHLVISLLKRWILGTHQGAISKQYLEYYLDEFTFRFNRRTSKSKGLLFQRLIENAVVTRPCPVETMKGVAKYVEWLHKH